MFTIRVYGLWLHNNSVLLSNESVKGVQVIKFPGGGLEFGEGTIDCLKREFIEELGLKIRVLRHLYTTDFFVQSFLNDQQQVISIYYLIEAEEISNDGYKNLPFNAENNQSFLWKRWDELQEKDLNFPIDKEILRRIKFGEIQI
ncbi:MAG: NUDIX domain-containing protein [Chitinophagales bacterium]|nr:NUDIX domain-containing protein [Bacteroidota bacterium]MBP8754420.1 NUDIX domain-containing protein [Chitinophagales bacterium]MBK8488198.1 NUDIX domain-containing protein [Bacteroidota bacterium]MBK8682041.1 NUDIX domain-containing protein [Bacteroidota bacterium]MBP9190210.1 NUDIX domain-containing protein [Chitinophagales bacterium]